MMQFRAVSTALLLLFLGSGDARITAGSPVEKVVNLLEDMKTRLNSDEAREQQTYDKYACWCEETTARKAKAIDQGRTDLRSLSQEIQIQSGIVESKTIEIEETVKDIKTNEESQAEATSIRSKENEAYMAESGEMKMAVAAIEKAVAVLGEATAFLQQSSSAGAAAKVGRELASVQAALAVVPGRSLDRLARLGGSQSKLKLLGTYMEQLHKDTSRYTPQSATITGILKDMYGSFAEDLQTLESEESDKNRNFEDLIATKQDELLTLQKKLKDAEKAKSEAELMLAEATESYDDTDAQLKADIEFFDTTVTACNGKSGAWKDRKQLREDEIAAVTKALEILGSDDARELFAKAINTPGVQQPSFLQKAAVEDSGSNAEALATTKRAYSIIKRIAVSARSSRLAVLATSVRSAKAGHFETVIASIDTMITDIKKEFKADIDKRDQCKDEYQKIESKSKDLNWKIKKNIAAIEKLKTKITKLGEEKTKTIEQIGDVEQAIVDLNSTRNDENQAYLAGKQDDEDAIALLKEARTVLAGFYKNNSIELGPVQGLLQTAAGPEFERGADEAPDANFSDPGVRKLESKGVVGLLTGIIEDLQGELAVSKKAEEASQLDYEKQLKAAQELILKLETKKTNLETDIGERTVDRDNEKQDKTDNEGDLKSETDYKDEIQPDCDFIISKFTERAAKRTAEIDGLVQAKDYLVGYQDKAAIDKDAALLQGIVGHLNVRSK